jgi:hypothetical protein
MQHLSSLLRPRRRIWFKCFTPPRDSFRFSPQFYLQLRKLDLTAWCKVFLEKFAATFKQPEYSSCPQTTTTGSSSKLIPSGQNPPYAIYWRWILTSARIWIAQSVCRRATGWKAWVQFPTVQDFSLLHSVQTGSVAHPASYPVVTGGKAAGAWY